VSLTFNLLLKLAAMHHGTNAFNINWATLHSMTTKWQFNGYC